jgi:hypothetical protein
MATLAPANWFADAAVLAVSIQAGEVRLPALVSTCAGQPAAEQAAG